MAKKMPRSLRKLVLTVHVVVSVGWIGIEASLLTLGLAGLYTRDPSCCGQCTSLRGFSVAYSWSW